MKELRSNRYLLPLCFKERLHQPSAVVLEDAANNGGRRMERIFFCDPAVAIFFIVGAKYNMANLIPIQCPRTH